VTPDRLDRIGALLDEAVGGGGIPGAVAVAGRGPVTLGRWVAGQADRSTERPMRADTVFDLASLTKVVATTTVTLALVGRGDLCLGDPVAGYLPDVPACRDGQVTIAHLLTHTSGLPGRRTFHRWCGTRAELLRDLRQTPLDAPPGYRVASSPAPGRGQLPDRGPRRPPRLRLGLPRGRLRHPGRPLAADRRVAHRLHRHEPGPGPGERRMAGSADQRRARRP